MTLLDGSRDRGGAPTLVSAKSKDGKRIAWSGPMKLSQSDFEYDVANVDGKPVGKIKAPSMKHAKDLVGKTKKDFKLSDNEVKNTLDNAKRVQEDSRRPRNSYRGWPSSRVPSRICNECAVLRSSRVTCAKGSDFVSYIDSIDENIGGKAAPG